MSSRSLAKVCKNLLTAMRPLGWKVDFCRVLEEFLGLPRSEEVAFINLGNWILAS